MSKEEPILVAIHCLVYNHELYLRQCLDGFVMQKTNFRFVAVVHDDVSTDKSADIIREYAEKYPDIIKPIFETENQWSKHDGSIDRVMHDVIDELGTKYVAMCEGDDYWTDSYKLQKQVDFLEEHPDYSLCCHGYSILNAGDGTIKERKDGLSEGTVLGITFTNVDNWKYRYTSTLTLVYRQDISKQIPELSLFRYFRDAHRHYYLLKYGKGYYMPFVGAVYRDHGNGEFSSLSSLQKDLIHIWIYDELYEHNPEDTNLASYLVELIEEQEKIFIWLVRDKKWTREIKNGIRDLDRLIRRRRGCRALWEWRVKLCDSCLKKGKRSVKTFFKRTK